MENNITAMELLDMKYPNFDDLERGDVWTNVEQTMIEFAKLKCQEQLKAILENVKTKEDVAIFQEGQYMQTVIDKDSIINAYDLNNIK